MNDLTIIEQLRKLRQDVERLKLVETPRGDIVLKVYPVGAIYISADATSPAVLFGGTWTAFGKGQVLVGKADSGTFATAGATGGAESHDHGLEDGFAKVAMGGSTTYMKHKDVTNWNASRAIPATMSTNTTLITVGTELGGTTDDGSNLQPYIVVYMWRRTA